MQISGICMSCFPLLVQTLHYVQSNQEMPDVMPSMDFKRVWQSVSTAGARGARDTRVLSIWRPVGPPGYSSLGDVAVAGSEPPSGKPVKMYKDVMGAGDAPGQVSSCGGFQKAYSRMDGTAGLNAHQHGCVYVAVAGTEPPSGKPVKMYKDVMGAGDAPGQVCSSQHKVSSLVM
jgi:hypothetical protein